MARSEILRQADAAAAILRAREPERVVVLGGDCGVDLAPFAYLSARHGGDLAVLWIDAHPDVMTPEHWQNSHAMVLGHLMGRGDPELAARAPVPLRPDHVMFAGLYDMSPAEREIVDGLGIGIATPGDLAASSDKVLAWLRGIGARHVAVHLDLDVIDPAEFRSLYFTRPGAAPDAFDGIPQGRMKIEQILRLLNDVAEVAEVVGLGITEFLPWDAIRLRAMLSQLPILRDEAG